MGVGEAFVAAFITGCTIILCPAAIIFRCWRQYTAGNDEVVMIDTAHRAGGELYVRIVRRQLDAELDDMQSRVTGRGIEGRSVPSFPGAIGAVEPAADFHPVRPLRPQLQP